MKKIIFAIMCVLCITMAHATDVATSQAYVDGAANTLQDNFPAKTSDKVATYTTTAGTTGEREIKTELGNESTNQADAGLTTVGTVKTAVDDKQKKVTALPATNVVTYSNTAGMPTVTPIYDSTVNTFDNGLVTAKTLNDAIIAGVEAEVTKIRTPKGALWRINRTAPKVLPTTANLPTNIEGTGGCYKSASDAEHTKGPCTTALYDSMNAGDWGVVFPYGEVKGESFCGTIRPNDSGLDGKGYGSVAPDQTALTNEYNTWVNAGRPDTVPGINCYCRESYPVIANRPWVLRYRSTMGTSGCAAYCAGNCRNAVNTDAAFRGVLFGAAAVPVQ